VLFLLSKRNLDRRTVVFLNVSGRKLKIVWVSRLSVIVMCARAQTDNSDLFSLIKLILSLVKSFSQAYTDSAKI